MDEITIDIAADSNLENEELLKLVESKLTVELEGGWVVSEILWGEEIKCDLFDMEVWMWDAEYQESVVLETPIFFRIIR